MGSNSRGVDFNIKLSAQINKEVRETSNFNNQLIIFFLLRPISSRPFCHPKRKQIPAWSLALYFSPCFESCAIFPEQNKGNLKYLSIYFQS